eukprot:5071167-Karenia_brevis.AAC.1
MIVQLWGHESRLPRSDCGPWLHHACGLDRPGTVSRPTLDVGMARAQSAAPHPMRCYALPHTSPPVSQQAE